MGTIEGVVAAQRQLAALRGKTSLSPRGGDSDETIKTITRVFSDYDSRNQLIHAPCWSSDKKPLRSFPGGAAFRLIAQHGGDHSSSYRGVQIRVLL